MFLAPASVELSYALIAAIKPNPQMRQLSFAAANTGYSIYENALVARIARTDLSALTG